MSDDIDISGELEQLDASGLFDGAWYLTENPDVWDSDLEPLVHFCRYGWRAARDASWRILLVLFPLEELFADYERIQARKKRGKRPPTAPQP